VLPSFTRIDGCITKLKLLWYLLDCFYP